MAARAGLTESVLAGFDEHPADDVRVGEGYAAVRVGTRIGLAMTMGGGPDSRRLAGDMVGKKLCGLALSGNLLEATIGTAAVNAHLRPERWERANAFDRILGMAGSYERAGVVGRFPFVEELKGLCREVLVFELRPLPGCLPASEAEARLPDCDLVIITGTTFVNHTMERLLELSTGYTMVVGPTTPLSPVLLDHGADVIAGALATDARVLEIVSQGGSARELMPLVEPVYIEKDPPL